MNEGQQLMKRSACKALLLILSICALGAAAAERKILADGRVEDHGLITPLDDSSMYLRTAAGRVEVRWRKHTKVAIKLNYRNLGNVSDRIAYTIHSSSEEISIPLPRTQPYAIKTFSRKSDIAAALEENWVSCRSLSIGFGKVTPKLPTADNLELIGAFTFSAGRGKPAKINVNGRHFEASMKKGGQTDVLIYDIWTAGDCKPFINEATVIGKLNGHAIIADEIHVKPIGDQAALDNPKLPRYLFIGDSISGNYNKGLRQALKGKFNIHHPPTNCGPSGKGVGSVDSWLGAYEVKGRHWDVISFNFGHWDAGNNKEVYQKNIEQVIAKLKTTRAKLMWATTCPVPKGYPAAAGLIDQGSKGMCAPARTNGVMEKYLNPWALEVIKKHSKIAICDQWQFVKDNEGGIYTEWWQQKNVHFAGEAADALGALLAKKVRELTKE